MYLIVCFMLCLSYCVDVYAKPQLAPKRETTPGRKSQEDARRAERMKFSIRAKETMALDRRSDNLFAMRLPLTKLRRVWLIVLIALAGVSAVVVLPPLKQPQEYHQFADQRSLLGIPNILNVISNGGFLLVGLMGLNFLLEKRAMGADTGFIEPSERLPYAVFFFGAVFTCFGSAYYHWNPHDSTLVWDRLPMTVAFMSILAAMIAERIDVKVGLRLLWPSQNL
jgi:hypothetical protein